MKLSEQIAILERENQRLQNMVDNLTDKLQAADYFIDIANRKYGFDRYVGKDFDLAPNSTQEVVRAWRKTRKEEPIETH